MLSQNWQGEGRIRSLSTSWSGAALLGVVTFLAFHSAGQSYLGKQEGKDLVYMGKVGKDLVYMGKVGTGWNRTTPSKIRKALDTVASPKSKLSRPLKKPKATLVEPMFFADVEYRDVTSEGLFRASSFKGPSKGTSSS